MLVGLQCNSCKVQMIIPILVGGSYPSINALCAKCGNGFMIVNSINVDNKTENSVSINIPINHTTDSSVSTSKSGGRNILTSFHNRISTLVVIVQMMLEMEENRVVELKPLLDNFSATSANLRSKLQDLENQYGVKRGERLSDGFPDSSEMNMGPMNITHRSMIGTDGERILSDRGLLQEMGLVKVDDGLQQSFILTDKADRFSDLQSLRTYLEQLTILELISRQPNMPKYFDEKTSMAIADIVFDLMPDEKEWSLHILEIISKASKESNFGWDSNHYAAGEVENCTNGNCNTRWSTRTGETMFEKYNQRAIKQKKRSPKDHAADRLEKYINGALGSLLSRMKELGFIFPVRVGNTKNFKITSLGEQVLEKYREKEMRI